MLKLDTPIADKDLLEAVSLGFCRHLPAMSMARAFGGAGDDSIPWAILGEFSAKTLIAEVNKRGLDISEVETAMASCECCPRLVVDTVLYAKALALLEGE